MSEEIKQENQETVAEEQVQPAEDTRHEPHEHALPRVVWGVAAVAVVIIGVVVWSRWGEDIKEACFGEDGVCEVEIEGIPEGGVAFERPEGFEVE
jgi:hypothetical protein